VPDKTRQPFFVVETPHPSAAKVVCYQDTWDIHMPTVRQNLGAQIVVGALQQPSLIIPGTTNEDYLIYLNQDFTSPGHNSPFAVIVDPYGQPMPAVASFGYRRDFKDLTGHTVLWLPPGKIVPSDQD
jgi:hypothetical protein